MSMRKPLLAIAMTLTFGAGVALAQSPGLGKPVSEADIKAWDIGRHFLGIKNPAYCSGLIQ